MVSKDDVVSWKQHPASKLFLKDTLIELDSYIATLANSAGLNQLEDRYKAGIIFGLQWLIDWKPSVLEIDEEDEDGADSEGSQDSD